MTDHHETLRDNRGMTLLELMMAVAVFGIILLFITQMTSTGGRLAAGNAGQVQMEELARAEAERIKSMNPTPSFNPPVLDEKDYPLGTTGQRFAVQYTTIEKEGVPGKMLRVVVGPLPWDPDNSENYVLVTWLPPRK